MEGASFEDATVSAGRGRGRGRGGGVPLLPSGMWDSLNSDAAGDAGGNDAATFEDAAVNSASETTEEQRFGTRAVYESQHNDRRHGPARDVKGVDWNCPKCDNLNWSWRARCNKCNTAKPVTALAADEKRDGVGGGFMERQEIASKATVEVDEDGFDDFGRRAKQSKADKRLKEEAALRRLRNNYGFLLQADEGDDAHSAGNTVASVSFAGHREDSARGIESRTSDGETNKEKASLGSERDRKNANGTGRDITKSGYRERSNDREGRRRDLDRDNRDRDRDRGRDRDSRDRDRDRGRDRDRDNREGDRGRDRDRDNREGDRGRDRDRDNREGDRGRERDFRRSRSRDRGRK